MQKDFAKFLTVCCGKCIRASDTNKLKKLVGKAGSVRWDVSGARRLGCGEEDALRLSSSPQQWNTFRKRSCRESDTGNLSCQLPSPWSSLLCVGERDFSGSEALPHFRPYFTFWPFNCASFSPTSFVFCDLCEVAAVTLQFPFGINKVLTALPIHDSILVTFNNKDCWYRHWWFCPLLHTDLVVSVWPTLQCWEAWLLSRPGSAGTDMIQACEWWLSSH